MTAPKALFRAFVMCVPLAWSTHAATAQDMLKLAIGQINNWENQAPTLGQEAGIFKKHGLVIDATGTSGGGETLQPVIAGHADIGIAVGVAGVLAAFSKGAPIRILMPGFTGGDDLYWYVKADSPIKVLKDATASNTIAYSTAGSSTNNVVRALAEERGVKARPMATGNAVATLRAVMSGQVDIGWAAPPFGLKEIKGGQIRIVGRGSEVPSLDGQTLRVTIVNADVPASRRDAIVRFAAAYRETVEWMYTDPRAVSMYAARIDSSVDLIAPSIAQFHPKAALQTEKMAGLDAAMTDAVKLKYLDAPLTAAQLDELVQIPPLRK